MKKNSLNIKTLSSLSEAQYEKGTVSLEIGEQTFEVEYQQKFKDSEIQELVKEWLKIKEVATQDNLEVNMYDISFILILKHFTDVPFDVFEDEKKQIEHYIRMTNLLIDLKNNEDISLFEKVFSALDTEEIKKVSNAMNKVSESILSSVEELQQSREYKVLRDIVEKEGE